VEVDVEVVDAPLDYNLLLGHNWTYAMTAIVLSVFLTLCFPHDGKIVKIDQFYFAYASPNASVGPSILVIENSQPETKNIEMSYIECIHPLWVPSTSWHRFIISMPCPVGLLH
jgi:hypothetical protein